MSLRWLVTPPVPVVMEGRKIVNIGFQSYRPTGKPLKPKDQQNAEQYARRKARKESSADAAGSGVRAADDGSVRAGKCGLCGRGRA